MRRRSAIGALISLIARPFRAAAQQGSAAMTPMSTDFIRWLSGASSSGKAVNDDSMLTVSAAWCCQRIIVESIGMIPWSMYRKTAGDNAEKADDHWLQDVLVDSPNRDQTTVEFRESLTAWLCGRGNAFSMIERLGKRITSLTPMPARCVKPMRKLGSNTKLNLRDGEVFFRYSDRGTPEDFPREKIWHVKGFGRDLLEGLSPLGAAREALGGALAMEEFANRFFAQGGMPAGTVSFPGWLTKEQKGEAQEALQKMVGGLGNSHQIALFQGGMKPEPWNTMNLEEMQFIIARKFSVLEVCRFYRVPPHMVAELEKGASYASIEQLSQEFVTFTLMPYFTRFEASVSKWLLPTEERGKYFLRFNFEGLLRAATKDRAEFLVSMVNNGLMNRNEARGKENLNRVDKPGMDDYTVQTALAPIGMLEKIAAPKPAPAPAAAPGKQSGDVTVNASVALPESMNHEVRHEVAITDVDRITDSHSDLVRRLADGNKRLVTAMADEMGAVTEAVRQSNAELAAQIARDQERLIETLREGLDAIAKQEREVSVGGEVFLSKPATKPH